MPILRSVGDAPGFACAFLSQRHVPACQDVYSHGMRIVHLGLWKILDGSEQNMLKVQEIIASFKGAVPGCLEASAAPLTLFERSADSTSSFGAGDAAQLTNGYNWALYMIFDSPQSRIAYEDDPLHATVAPYLMPSLDGPVTQSILQADFPLPE